jgi:ribosomal protein L3
MRAYIAILKDGTKEQKKQLFDELMTKAVDGEIQDSEVIVLEALKKDLFTEKKIVDMSATATGVSGVRI